MVSQQGRGQGDGEPAVDLDVLRGEAAPPARVEEAILARGRGIGLLRPRRGPARGALALAAGVALFLGGVLVGRAQTPAAGVQSSAAVPDPSARRFLLTVLVDSAMQVDLDADAGGRLASELGTWASELARAGRLVYAERLQDEGGVELDPGGGIHPLDPFTPRARLSGLFVIEAEDFDQAIALARESPHLRYGGQLGLIPVYRARASP